MDTPAEELLKKIQELEAGHAQLKQEMSKLMLGGNESKHEHGHQRSHSLSPQRTRLASNPKKKGGLEAAAAWGKGSASFRHPSPLQRESKSRDAAKGDDGGGGAAAAVHFTDKQCLNILHSMGQSVHIFDLDGRVIYWNRSAEHLYGYSASEAIGQDSMELLIDARDFDIASNIIDRITMGESWTGQIPVKSKSGDRFFAVCTNTPFYDDDGHLVGIICVSNDSRPFQEIRIPSTGTKPSEVEYSYNRSKSSSASKTGVDSQQPLQVAIASKISNLASKVTNKVRSRIRTSEPGAERESGSGDGQHSDHDANLSDHREDAASSGNSTPTGDVPHSPFGTAEEGDGKAGIHKIISSKAEAWIAKKGISWPWKGNERDGAEGKTRFVWPWLNNDHETDPSQRSSETGTRSEHQVTEINRPGNNEASGSWLSFNVNSTSSVSSSGSTNSSALHKVDMETDCLDYEILWEDLTIGEQIGQGSCGTVYHGLWYGSDVAVKVFSKQEYSEEVILSFRQEISLMKRLRHPNILLFMGAITSPQRLCIVTEFLPSPSDSVEGFLYPERTRPELIQRRKLF